MAAEIKDVVKSTLEVAAFEYFDVYLVFGADNPATEHARKIYLAQQNVFTLAGGTPRELAQINDEMRACAQMNRAMRKYHERQYNA